MKFLTLGLFFAFLSTHVWAGTTVTQCHRSSGLHFCRADLDLVIVRTDGDTSVAVTAQKSYSCDPSYKKTVLLDLTNHELKSIDGRQSLAINERGLKFDDKDIVPGNDSYEFNFPKNSCIEHHFNGQ